MHCKARGSSPRVWGLRATDKGNRVLFRFIPTCVGFTFFCFFHIGNTSVHPHVCGVYGCTPFEHLFVFRFIPTCVGFTHTTQRCASSFTGSSPRVWGLHFAPLHPRKQPRFIPTCVGFTLSRRDKMVEITGSSPRVWGLRLSKFFDGVQHRFIPTCVGFTDIPWTVMRRLSVHPHVCGVYAVRSMVSNLSSVHPHVCGVYTEIKLNFDCSALQFTGFYSKKILNSSR